MPRRLKYTHRRGNKYAVAVRVHPGPGGLKTCTMDLTATPADIEAWVQEQRDKYSLLTDKAGGLREKAAAYFARRADLPAHTKVRYERLMAEWVHALGADRAPLSVETSEIDAILNRWIPQYSPGYIHNRRSVLFTFYGTMYPTHANPVKDAKDPPLLEPEARELSYVDIDAAIASMPTYRSSQPVQLNLAKLRLRVQAETGLPPGIVRAVRASDLNFAAGTLFVPGRNKGTGIEPRTMPLSPDALAAFKAFHAANAYGPDYSIDALNVVFKRACKRIGLPPARVNQYILRHSFLTNVYRVTKDESTVQRLGLHAPGSRITKRYTKAAHPEIDRAAVDAFSAFRTQLRRQHLKAAPLPRQERGNAPGQKRRRSA